MQCKNCENIPDESILFGGCLVKSLNSSTLGNANDAVIDQWPKTIKKVFSNFPNVAVIIPGHGSY
ncbi:MAG: hypothetical protein HQ521_06490 [Bacteroidetes bacterium]|nr:hypothetical protein [Bacteroidota bacterium]